MLKDKWQRFKETAAFWRAPAISGLSTGAGAQGLSVFKNPITSFPTPTSSFPTPTTSFPTPTSSFPRKREPGASYWHTALDSGESRNDGTRKPNDPAPAPGWSGISPKYPA